MFPLQVNEILARSSVWSAFKDQKHDLFISESQTAGYLTGNSDGNLLSLFTCVAQCAVVLV